jgi:hypothetical protein
LLAFFDLSSAAARAPPARLRTRAHERVARLVRSAAPELARCAKHAVVVVMLLAAAPRGGTVACRAAPQLLSTGARR